MIEHKPINAQDIKCLYFNDGLYWVFLMNEDSFLVSKDEWERLAKEIE